MENRLKRKSTKAENLYKKAKMILTERSEESQYISEYYNSALALEVGQDNINDANVETPEERDKPLQYNKLDVSSIAKTSLREHFIKHCKIFSFLIKWSKINNFKKIIGRLNFILSILLLFNYYFTFCIKDHPPPPLFKTS